MVADISKIQFDSRLFAELICRERALRCLKDGTVYVLTERGSDWEDAVHKEQISIQQSKMRAFWHLPYNIDALTDMTLFDDDVKLLDYMKSDARNYNLLMPLYTPDRSCKLYFVGRIDDVNKLDAVFTFLSVDAQKICDECSFAAFATSVETEPDKAKNVWMQLIDNYGGRSFADGAQISFRGKYNKVASEFTFLGKGFEALTKIPKIEYVDLLESLERLPDTIEALSKKDDHLLLEKKMEYVRICHSLSVSDKNELILELAKRINDKNVLQDAIDTVMNKGKSSRLKVRLIKKASVRKTDGRRIHGDWCTYLVDENENMQWLDFEPSAQVIYIMNLLKRKYHPDVPSVVDVNNNAAAFIAIYDYVYGGKGEEQFKRLSSIVEKEDGSGVKKKRLKDFYKIIANCINTRCSFYNEIPSPYIANAEKPLTIDPSLIEIPQRFIDGVASMM